MNQLTLSVLDGLFSIHRLAPDAKIPEPLLNSNFVALTRTAEELSIVCSQELDISCDQSEPGWCCLKVEGQLNFNLTGILAGLSRALADAGISLFAVSTFDTDYLLVRSDHLAMALDALRQAGYLIR